MAGPRAEESLLTSLRELRSIEDQRLADEHAAREAAVQAKRRAREAAEQAVRDAQAAQLRERREAELAAAQARDAAERSARLALETAQAAELARAQIALDHRRLAEDSALRREVAQRQRPRWMITVTALSLGAAITLGWFAAARAHDADAARAVRDRAIAARHEAQDEARAAREALDRLSQQLAALEARIEQGLRQLEVVKTEAERREALAALERLRQQHADLVRHGHPTTDVPPTRGPHGPIKISDDCLRNVLCN
jgi:colicin import membrane protein